MLVIGLILLVAAVGLLGGAVFVSEGTDITFYGIEVIPLTLYLLGAGTVGLLWAALLLLRAGTKKEIRVRREHKELTRMNQQRNAQHEKSRPKAPPDGAAPPGEAGPPGGEAPPRRGPGDVP